jgi:NADPH-dependent curcumin reductase CurA
MTSRRSILLASRPKGAATLEHFQLEEAAVPQPGEGQFLVRVIWMSLDPYMRGRMNAGKSYAAPDEVGAVMGAGGVGEVIASRHAGFAVGDVVVGGFGWTSHAVSDGEGVRKVDPAAAPLSAHLGVLGMPGITAWVGLTDILALQPGETVVISAATGAVGSVAGQIARARGCRVIGVAGGPEKCAYAVDALGYDACLDRRAGDAEALSAGIAGAAPGGVQGYFENVGGKTLAAVLPQMSVCGRIAVCGMISWYQGANLDEALPLPAVWRTVLTQRLRVQGFIIFDHYDRFDAFAAEVAPMLADGRVTAREDVATGLENAPAKFLAMLAGGNFGKTLVRIGDDP